MSRAKARLRRQQGGIKNGVTHQSLGNPARKTQDACLDGQATAKVPSMAEFFAGRGVRRENGVYAVAAER